MIDYASIAPMMSLSTFIAGFIIVLLIARLGVELVEIYGKKKSPSNRGNDRTSRRGLTPSQKAIQRYYNRNQYENKGA